jgi:sigma-B regulation protein RsbU (phosphoserine phosphatase)
MSDPPSAPADARPRFGLTVKILLGLTLFNVAATVIFSVNHYFAEKKHIMSELQDKLADYAIGLPQLLPEGYLDKAVSAEAVSPADYRRIVDQLTRYCDNVGLRYLYSYIRGEKGFYCTSSNGTPEEMAQNKFTPYWDLYTSAPPQIQEAWDTGRPVYADVTDAWGHSFTLFLPLKTAAGTRYIAGADLTIAYVDQLLRESMVRSILVAAVTFVLFLVASYFIGTRFSRQIVELAAYTRELVRANFKADIASPLRTTILSIPERSRDEVGQLAASFITMEQRLERYLLELKESTAANERFQNELRIAGEIQASMLPREFTQPDAGHRIALSAIMKPAKEAGGDLYDFFFLDADHLCFVIGDVSDKGMPAALFMAVTLTILRAKATAAFVETPEEILAQTNELLIKQNQMYQFVTMFLGIVNVRTGRVVYSDGGHNRPYLCTSANGAHMLPPGGGIALGVMPGAAFKHHQLDLRPGETLFLYTDGVTEAIAADESFYGEKRLETLLSSVPGDTTPGAWVELVAKNVAEFSRGHPQADDITMLAVRFKS